MSFLACRPLTKWISRVAPDAVRTSSVPSRSTAGSPPSTDAVVHVRSCAPLLLKTFLSPVRYVVFGGMARFFIRLPPASPVSPRCGVPRRLTTAPSSSSRKVYVTSSATKPLNVAAVSLTSRFTAKSPALFSYVTDPRGCSVSVTSSLLLTVSVIEPEMRSSPSYEPCTVT